MRKFYNKKSSDDGYDRYKDDRDGYVSAQEQLDRQAALAEYFGEIQAKSLAEFCKKNGLKD
jgi:hypothetical protein